MLKDLDTRTVLRITLIRNYNDQKEMIPAFADMFRKASPHFIEIKSYMHIGRSTNRLEHENMLEMSEVKKFSEEIAKQSKIFSVMDESLVSRISILRNIFQIYWKLLLGKTYKVESFDGIFGKLIGID